MRLLASSGDGTVDRCWIGRQPSEPAAHFLHVGQVHVSRDGQSVVVILGSCVAVCLWDPVNRVGGATHYLLPEWDGRGPASPRYGNIAITDLVQKLVEKGAERKGLQAKIFGGGCLFSSLRAPGGNGNHLGSRNLEIAVEGLTKERIPIVAVEAGRHRGQRIVFRTDTGEASITTL